MAKEYIEREAVIELLEEKQRAICPVGRCGHGYVYGRDRDEYDDIEADIDTVENIPAADVALVVHGRWRRYSPLTDTWECDKCGYQVIDESFRTNYCPDCGARMVEVQDDLQNS